MWLRQDLLSHQNISQVHNLWVQLQDWQGVAGIPRVENGTSSHPQPTLSYVIKAMAAPQIFQELGLFSTPSPGQGCYGIDDPYLSTSGGLNSSNCDLGTPAVTFTSSMPPGTGTNAGAAPSYATPGNTGAAAATIGTAHPSTQQPPFATPSTVGECLAFLQPGLEAAGVTARLPDWTAAGADPNAAMASVLNAAYELLRLLQRSGEQRKRQDELLDRLRAEARTADRAAQQLRGQSEQREQEAASLKIKLRQLDSWYRSEVDRWGAERDEIARRNTQLEQRHTQFVHELRRKDAEFERLQGKLRATLRATSGVCVSSDDPYSSSSSSSAHQQQHPARRTSSIDYDPTRRTSSIDHSGNTPQQLRNAAHRRSSGGGAGVGGAGVGGARPGALRRSSATGPGQAAVAASPASATPAAATAGAPTPPLPPAPVASSCGATWHEVSAKLAALRVRAQRVAASGSGQASVGAGGAGDPLSALSHQASSQHERLLVAKLVEASSIMQEQEQALKAAIEALAGGAAGPGAGQH